ncbi:uncharacterized protein LOC143281176 [Babylonia areolata]|uniref:uncharacterized protein LOC143281176 n=1 Tax=Babylonia areolata TaxID=304850 RepID=UPI003FD4F542
MAAAASHTTQKLQNEFLSCPRCSQPFKDPKALPCMHNFCKACLQMHIDEQMAGGRHTSFACPICSKKIFVPDPSKNTGAWASQFPSNFVLKGMLEAIAAGSPQAAAPPGSGGQRHPLAADNRGSSSSSPAGRDRNTRVDSVEVPDVVSHPGVEKVLSKLKELKSSVKTEEAGVMGSLTQLSRQRDDQERSMSDAVTKLQEILTMRKTGLLEDLSSCFNDEVEKLRQRVQSCKDHLQSLRTCEDLLRSVATLPEDDDTASELLESVKVQLEEVQFRPRQENPSRIVLEYDAMSVYKVTEALASFGSVRVVKGDDSSPRPAAPIQPPTGHQPPTTSTPRDVSDGLSSSGAEARVPGSTPPQLVEKIVPRELCRDGQGIQVYDITVTKGGTLVMTVYGEKMVQAFRAPRLQGSSHKVRGLLGRVQLDTQPGCLCMLSETYVAVVGDMCVYLIAVLPDRLELKRTIPTGKKYSGIAAYGESTLVASCQNPVCVDFVGLNGFINETIDKDLASGHALFRRPNFLAAASRDGLLFVTDGPRMVCLNNAGKVKYVFPKGEGEQLSNAEGVCCDPAGYVYLVDRGRHCVVALSARGTRIADIITERHGLTDPCAVTMDEQGLLYVTNDFMEILVFRVC